MERDTIGRFASIVRELPAARDTPNRSLMYMWLIQNKIRLTLCAGAIIGLNTVLFRKFVLPQFGVIVTGFWRTAAVDWLPAILFLNYRLGYQMAELSSLVDELSPHGSPGAKAFTRNYEKVIKEKELNRKYLGDSQYWH